MANLRQPLFLSNGQRKPRPNVKKPTKAEAKKTVDQLIASVGNYERDVSAVDDLLLGRRR